MTIIAYLLGFGYIAISACMILYTQATLDTLKGLTRKYPLKYLSAVSAAVGILFFICASATTYPWVLRIVGLVAIGEAVLAYLNPQDLYTRMLAWYFEKVSEQGHRLFGIIGIIFGTVLLSWIE